MEILSEIIEFEFQMVGNEMTNENDEMHSKNNEQKMQIQSVSQSLTFIWNERNKTNIYIISDRSC